MVAIKYKLSEIKAISGIDRAAAHMENMQPALKDCGLVLIRSIAKNFKAGGRPKRWKKSARAKRSGGQTLVETARLKNSITMEATGRRLTVGTNVKYARIHQLGGHISANVTVKKHWRIMTRAFGKRIPARSVMVRSHKRQMSTDIPARPFLMVHPADWRIFKRIIVDYVTEK